MTWRDAHRRSEAHAAKAQVLLDSDPSLARQHYAKAARFEREALDLVPPQLQRTRAILAVSYAALLYKSGQTDKTLSALDELSGQHWPEWATRQLEEIREALVAAMLKRARQHLRWSKSDAAKHSVGRKLKRRRTHPLSARKAMA